MKKVAVIRRNGLGDLLCTYPLILYLKSRGDRVTLFVEEKNAPLLPYLPPVDESFILPSKGNKYWNHISAAVSFRRRFDTAISAKTSPMKVMNFFLAALGAPERFAYIYGNLVERLLITHPTIYCEATAKRTHQALKTLHLVAPHFRNVPEEFYPKIDMPQNCTTHFTFSLPPPILLLSATTTRATNRLNARRYGALANIFAATRACHSVLVMAQKKEDAVRAHAIAQMIQVPCVIYFPRNFEEFMVLLNRCDFYFVGDGGIAHIGAALGKQGVVLFGESNPVEWAPLGKGMKTLFHPKHVDLLSDQAINQVLCARENM